MMPFCGVVLSGRGGEGRAAGEAGLLIPFLSDSDFMMPAGGGTCWDAWSKH